MEYIVIEKQGGAEYAIIITNEDGSNKVFTNIVEAQAEADEYQDAIVIPIS